MLGAKVNASAVSIESWQILQVTMQLLLAREVQANSQQHWLQYISAAEGGPLELQAWIRRQVAGMLAVA